MNDIFTLCLRVFLAVYFFLESYFMMFVPRRFRYKDVKGEIVLITGGGAGLGRQLAVKFAALGCRIVLWDVDEKGNRETAEVVTRRGGECWSYVCDITRREMVYQTAKKVKDEVGHVNILINNAGVLTGKRMLDCPDHLIEKTFKVNVLSHFWTCKSFLPYMIARNHGHIVTVASFAGLSGFPKLSDYCASKFAAVGFFESLFLELKKEELDGIKVTLICPSAIDTALSRGITTGFMSLLKAENVADEIISAVLTDEEFVIIPRWLRLALVLKYAIPPRAGVELFRAMKGDKLMDTFVGRSGKIESIKT